MDRLEVRLIPRKGKDDARWVAVDLLVSGTYLKDLVETYERARRYKPAGGYDSIALDGLQPAAARLAGSSDDWPEEGETVLLVCQSCGEEGCWPILARVTLFEDVVEWSAFSQPVYPERDYTDFHFTFDRGQYDAEMRLAFGQP